jgi:Fe/S biogenesis protein NfuA
MVDVTLRQGIEALIREEIPEIQQVIDTTDHASGHNPYYQPAKG